MVKERGSRVEKDVIGDLEVPKDAYYGIFTERASENFPISGIRIHGEMNRAIVLIKREAAMANVKLRLLNVGANNTVK